MFIRIDTLRLWQVESKSVGVLEGSVLTRENQIKNMIPLAFGRTPVLVWTMTSAISRQWLIDDCIAGVPVNFKTLDRGCIEVPKDSDDHSDGCHTDLPFAGPIRDFVQSSFSGVQEVEDITFKGKTCYDTTSVEGEFSTSLEHYYC